MAKKQKSRRYKGSGSIIKLPDGRFQVRGDIGKDFEGKRIRPSKILDDIRSAQKYLDEILDMAEGGQSSVDPSTRLYDAVKTFYETYRKPGLSESSIEIYDHILDAYIKPSLIAGMPLGKVTDDHIQQLFNDVGSTKGKTTVKRVKSLISGPLKRAHEKGAIKTNPLAGTRIIGAANTNKKEKIKYLTVDQQRKLMDYCYAEKRPRFMTIAAMTMTGLATGLRIGEICALRDTDVDLDTGVISVNQAIKRRSVGLKTNIPKTEKSIRDVPIINFALPIMKRYREFRDEHAMTDVMYQSSGLFFRTPHGGPIDPRNATRSIQTLLGHAGLDVQMGFHELRHTYATRMLEADINPRVVQELLGHSSVEITLGIYSHVSVQSKEAATKKIADLYPAPGENL